MVAFVVLTAVTFSLFGVIIGIWADNFETLQFVPLLIVTPLTFLGGSVYSIAMLPPLWQTIALINPVVCLVSGFRRSFFGTADVALWGQLRHDLGGAGDLPGDRHLDVPNGIQTEKPNPHQMERANRCRIFRRPTGLGRRPPPAIDPELQPPKSLRPNRTAKRPGESRTPSRARRPSQNPRRTTRCASPARSKPASR